MHHRSAGAGRLALPESDSEDVRRAHDELAALRSGLRPNQHLRWGNAAPLHDDYPLSLSLCVCAARTGHPSARPPTYLRVRLSAGIHTRSYQPAQDRPSVVLFPLHGSVLWGARNASVGHSQQIVRLARMARDPQGHTHLIKYPTLGSAELLSEPIASQYQFFRDVLAGTRLLVIIGSSLRDIAILDVIRQALDRNPDLHIGYLDPEKDHEWASRMIQCDPNRISAYRGPFVKEGANDTTFGQPHGTMSWVRNILWELDGRLSVHGDRTLEPQMTSLYGASSLGRVW